MVVIFYDGTKRSARLTCLTAFCTFFAGSTAGSQSGDLRTTNSTSALLSNGPLSGIGPIGQSSPNTTSRSDPYYAYGNFSHSRQQSGYWNNPCTVRSNRSKYNRTKSAKTFLQNPEWRGLSSEPRVSQKPAVCSPVNDTSNISRGTARSETSLSFIFSRFKR